MTKSDLIEKIMDQQDSNGCWNVEHDDNYGPELDYYVPNYKSTLWTLILLADIECNCQDERIKQPLEIITNHFWNEEYGIFAIGKSHFPIPCLNGNILYLLGYFNQIKKEKINRVIDFFYTYQRFDDGDFKTPSQSPYYNNKSCYGSHTCYWGVVKLLKGLSFVSEQYSSKKAELLKQKCIEFILLHKVCFSSHDESKLLNPMIGRLTLPNMYKADVLEILWLLCRENIQSDQMQTAIELLNSKMKTDGTWELERQVRDLIVPITKKKLGNDLITKRAKHVMDFYGH